MSDARAPDWVVPVMRAGYSARGAVYLILGGITLWAALFGGQTDGTQGALERLRGAPFGQILLWIIALGFICYAVWRLIAAWYDLERRGEDDSGLAERAGLVVTGLIHAALGVGIAGLAMGGGSGGGDSGAQDWTAKLMQMPGGKWLVAAVALGILGAGVHYILKGYKKKYERYIQVTETTRKLTPLLRWGFVAYGIVLGIVGAFLAIAALNSDPSSAKGIGGALQYIRGMTFGRILLGLTGLGIMGFGVENIVEAIYRVVPGVRQTQGVRTLANRAEAKARAAAG